ncbi:MAG: hypothetical protein H6715_05370 [Myxococcales bacterium]|nr:hypothetical protein [Myxococcales bacterium]
MANKRGSPGETESPRLDALMYAIDRDVLHFGIVAAARLIKDPFTEAEFVLSKCFFGLESSLLAVPSYKNASLDDKLSTVEELISKIAESELGWKLAIFQLLFNDANLDGWDNQIFTGGGDIVLIDRKHAEPFLAAVPCYASDIWDQISFASGPETELRDLYANQAYEEFERHISDTLGYPLRVFQDGTIFTPRMPYFYLLAGAAVLPVEISRRLNWVLTHRSETETVIQRYFEQWAINSEDDVEPTTQIGTCLFYERIAWLAANQRLPTEAEGTIIVNRCYQGPLPFEQWDCKNLTQK